MPETTYETLTKAIHAAAALTIEGDFMVIRFTANGNPKVKLDASQHSQYEAWRRAYNVARGITGGTLATAGPQPEDTPEKPFINEADPTNETVRVAYNLESRASFASAGSVASVAGVASSGTGATAASIASIAGYAGAASVASRPALALSASIGSLASVATLASRASQASSGTDSSRAAVASIASRASAAAQPSVPEFKGYADRPTSDLGGGIPSEIITANGSTIKQNSDGFLELTAKQPNNPTEGFQLIVERNISAGNVIRHVNYKTGAETFKQSGNNLYFTETTRFWDRNNLVFDFSHVNMNFPSSLSCNFSAPISCLVTNAPTIQVNRAKIYAKDISSLAEIFVMDEGGTETQISAHSRQAPDSLYDDADGMPDMIVEEVQHYAGKIRYTNKTRLARLMSLTDIEKSALTPEQRQVSICETFAEHEARTGNKLKMRDWTADQEAAKAEYDAKRAELQAAYDAAFESGDVDEIAAASQALTDHPAKDIRKPKPNFLA